MAGFIIGILVFAVTGFIIMCAVRLSLYSRLDELEIMRLVGATSRQVRLPALFEGALLGLAGALAALIALYFIFVAFMSWLITTSAGRVLVQHLELPSVLSMFGVIFAGLLVGTAGSYFAVRELD